MAGNDRIGHTGESAVLKVNVRTAHLAHFDFEDRGVALQLRQGQFTNLTDRAPITARRWGGHDGSDGVGSTPHVHSSSALLRRLDREIQLVELRLGNRARGVG